MREVQLADVVDAGDGPRQVCTIDRLAEVVRLAPLDWRTCDDPDPRDGPQIHVSKLRKVK